MKKLKRSQFLDAIFGKPIYTDHTKKCLKTGKWTCELCGSDDCVAIDETPPEFGGKNFGKMVCVKCLVWS